MNAPSRPAAPPAAVRVWDLPTRLVHWLLVACVVGLVITGHVAGNALVWHMRFGLTVGSLLLFRVLWGLVGGRWSRFASFAYSPGAVWRYLRGRPREEDRFDIGHNPLGSFSVFALLALMLVQVATGLLADDEIATTGPLNRFVSGATASLATGWHKDVGQVLILTLIGLHVAAIVYYHWRKGRNLVRPMWSGDKTLPAGTPASSDNAATRALAALLFGACAALAVWVAQFG
jgi:cytochrome b